MEELKKVTKIYTLRNFGGGSFIVNWCGQSIKLEFIAGRGAVGSKRSVLTVADRFTQDAIEHDPRFGRLITLDSIFSNDKTEEEMKVIEENTPKPNVRYTRRELEAMKAAQQKAAEAPKEEVKEESKPKKKAKKVEGPTAEQVESVTTLNDAYDYFAERGIVVENEDDLKDAMKNANVAFPNLK